MLMSGEDASEPCEDGPRHRWEAATEARPEQLGGSRAATLNYHTSEATLCRAVCLPSRIRPNKA